ncbi:MAG: single-stranded-DNA-specific exonuclease RecJ, partial [Rhodospirillales bacterium]
VNRALVRQGLAVAARRANAGMAALADVAGLKQAPAAYHLGFVLGPRVNAGGRVGEADLGARLLATEDAEEARKIALHLNDLNRERQEIERRVLEDAIARIEKSGGPGAVVNVCAEGWHPGVIGNVASRLKDRYARPALVTAIGEDGIGKGSGRSVNGADIGSAVIAARQAGLLMNGGGHPMAAGWTVTRDQAERFAAFIAERLGGKDGAPPQAVYDIDAALQPSGATPALCGALARLEPYGAGNPRPVFALPGARVTYSSVVGTGHVRCAVTGAGGGRLNAIAFRTADTELGKALLQQGGAPLHLAGYVNLDTWNGEERVQLVIEDGALAG